MGIDAQNRKVTDRMQNVALECPVSKKCGGCQLSNMTYAEQLSFKQAKVIRLLGKMHRVSEIIPSPRVFHYRNKVQAAFGKTKSGMIISGVYQSSTHNIVKTDACKIEDEAADAIIATIREMLRSFGLTVYDERTGKGFLRHVLVKHAFATGEIMVVLVTGTPVFKSKNAFCEELLRRHPDITTIIQNVNNRFTSLVLGEKETVLYGSGYITDVLCGVRFRISSRSFYQINRDCAELMFTKALEYAELTGNERVIDAYSGVGTIGLIAASKAKEVISVELNREAVKDAITNARINGIRNTRFYCADATDFLADMASAGQNADLVIMDPPRAGSTVKFMKSVVSLSPEKILYISCNPETLARDLTYFLKNQYGIKKCCPFD
ncbi:MAG: 23S rRNA (uracil(1939)-C(5))-methyltransferase RlmD, partial [Clostridia bacterium]|nr:23S rRNA (uracil(1939)-C(5))-methyltransferase RlmD [Clostridia bacterium]